MRERDELLGKVFIGKSELVFGRKRKMKTLARFLLWLVIGVVSTAAFLGLSLWLDLVASGALKYPLLGVEYKFHRYERSFETVYQFIDDFDLTPYQVDGEPAPYISIKSIDAINDEKAYKIYIREKEVSLGLNDSVTQALDILFEQARITHIIQLAEPDDQYVYFTMKEYYGVAYSKSGEKPVGIASGYVYYFKPMNGNWFYWDSDDD
jgi:hypothetical protein